MGRVIYDITQILNAETLVYPGDPLFTMKDLYKIDNGDSVNLSALSMCLHTGTHIDAPRHFYNNGSSIADLPWTNLMGKVKVLELMNKEVITALDLMTFAIAKDELILLKTNNSALLSATAFNPEYTYLTVDAAEYLVKVGITTFGFDYLSVDQFGNYDFPVHHLLLGNQIVIIEGINLSGVEPGEYQMVAMPLKIKDADGSPARVILYQASELE